MNPSRSGLLKSGGSVGSIHTVSMNDLPNLPGVRRDVSLVNPKLYKEFKASQSRGSIFEEDVPHSPEDHSLMSYFEDSSKFDFSRVTTPFPSDGHAYNDLSGRYSIVSQRKDRMNKSRTLPYSSTDSLPPFVTNTSKVCCYVAYFSEPATDVTEERSRKVNIKLYLEDNSLEIMEPKVENSGTIQGKFLKRHQVYKPVQRLSDKQKMLYTIEDMKAGARLDIYNRIYTIVDCDRATMQHMEDIGVPFGNPLPLPSNIYDPRTRSGMSRASSRSSVGGKTKKSLGFFEYDRKVLRFFGIWDSRVKLFGDALQVKVHYYLADDKIEIVSVHERNNGRDHLPTLLKKTQLMKKPSTASSSFYPERSSSSPTVRDDVERPYHWTDLRIGETISVAALDVLLVDADEFTRDFYNNKSMPLGDPIPMEQPVYPTVTNVIPPYNGFGSEEDSLQTCKNSLIPSAPMKDGLKAKLFQGLILRYAAVINNPKEADKTRQFIIQVHLEDDTFQIREPPVRNSGHKGGIFLARCKLESHDGTIPLQPQDLHIGATVTILSHKFDILDCDQYTFKYMEANCSQWKYSDLKAVEAKVVAKKEVIQRLILTLPGLAARSMDVKELQEIFERSGLVLQPQEVHTIFRAVDTYRVGSIKATKILKFFIDLR